LISSASFFRSTSMLTGITFILTAASPIDYTSRS
jgi:hypothetical protein